MEVLGTIQIIVFYIKTEISHLKKCQKLGMGFFNLFLEFCQFFSF
jgi:hypothetical protein